MPLANVNLTFNSINVSVQVGDVVFYTTGGGQLGGFNNADLQNTVLLGTIIAINNNIITVLYNDSFVSAPPIGSYISFAKDKIVNTSSLLGYYALARFVNWSEGDIELFSVSSEITESSK